MEKIIRHLIGLYQDLWVLEKRSSLWKNTLDDIITMERVMTNGFLVEFHYQMSNHYLVQKDFRNAGYHFFKAMVFYTQEPNKCFEQKLFKLQNELCSQNEKVRGILESYSKS